MTAIDRYRFLTFSCFSRPANEVVGCLGELLEARGRKERFRFYTESLSLDAVYIGEPPRGGAHLVEAAVFSPRTSAGSSVLFANLQDGWSSMVHKLSAVLGGTSVKVATSGDGFPFPTQWLQLWRGGRSVRIVRVMNDGNRWDFYSEGELQSFEQPAYYEKRAIKQRLTRAILVEYMGKLGWSFDRDDFWQSEAPAWRLSQLRH